MAEWSRQSDRGKKVENTCTYSVHVHTMTLGLTWNCDENG